MAESASFIAEEGIWIYCDQFTVLNPGKILGVQVPHLAVTGGNVNYVQYKDGYCVKGKILKVADGKGFLGWCEVQCMGQAKVVLQKNQVLGVLFPLLSNIDIFPNKFIFLILFFVHLIFH